MVATRFIGDSLTLNSTAGAGVIGYSASVEYDNPTVGTKLQKIAYITDAPYSADPTGVLDCSAAFSLAFITETRLHIPEGTYKLLSCPTAPTGSIKVTSDDAIFLIAHSGARAFLFQPVSLDDRVNLSGFTLQANSASGPCPLMIEIEYPSTTSYTYSQVSLTNIRMKSDFSASTPWANTVGRGIRLKNVWFPVIDNVFGGSYYNPGTTANTGFLEFTGGSYGSIGARVSNVEWTYGSDGIRCSAYTEGLSYTACQFVGTTRGLYVPSSTPFGGASGTARAYALWSLQNHSHTVLCGHDLDGVINFRSIAHDTQRWTGLDPAVAVWAGFSLNNVQYPIITNGLIGGNEALGTVTSTGILATGSNSAHGIVQANKFENLDTQFSLDSSTSGWVVGNNKSTGATPNTYSVLGTHHDIRWTQVTGEIIYMSDQFVGPIMGGTYTPTLTNVANAPTTTSYPAYYYRVGNMVTVFGRFDITPTAAVATQIGLSLPVASALATIQQCSGSSGSKDQGTGGAVYADVTNDRAEVGFKAASTSAQGWSYTFSYIVL